MAIPSAPPSVRVSALSDVGAPRSVAGASACTANIRDCMASVTRAPSKNIAAAAGIRAPCVPSVAVTRVPVTMIAVPAIVGGRNRPDLFTARAAHMPATSTPASRGSDQRPDAVGLRP